MIIRRRQQRAELRNVPLDGFDMFLLNLLQDGLSLTQLVESAPRDATETLSHVLHLTQLGLLQLDFDTFDEALMFKRFASGRCEPLDYATTDRPPARNTPTPTHTTLASSRTKASAPRTAVPIGAVEKEPSTGIRPRPSIDGGPTRAAGSE